MPPPAVAGPGSSTPTVTGTTAASPRATGATRTGAGPSAAGNTAAVAAGPAQGAAPPVEQHRAAVVAAAAAATLLQQNPAAGTDELDQIANAAGYDSSQFLRALPVSGWMTHFCLQNPGDRSASSEQLKATVTGFRQQLAQRQLKMGRPVTVFAKLGVGGQGSVYVAQELDEMPGSVTGYVAGTEEPFALKVFSSSSRAMDRPWTRRELVTGKQLPGRFNQRYTSIGCFLTKSGHVLLFGCMPVARRDLWAHTCKCYDAGLPLQQHEVLFRMAQAAIGLQEAHRHGIVHRDFKPANVLEGKDGVSRNADYGLAKWLEKGDMAAVHSAQVGTKGYVPPEAMDGFKAYWKQRGDKVSADLNAAIQKYIDALRAGDEQCIAECLLLMNQAGQVAIDVLSSQPYLEETTEEAQEKRRQLAKAWDVYSWSMALLRITLLPATVERDVLAWAAGQQAVEWFAEAKVMMDPEIGILAVGGAGSARPFLLWLQARLREQGSLLLSDEMLDVLEAGLHPFPFFRATFDQLLAKPLFQSLLRGNLLDVPDVGPLSEADMAKVEVKQALLRAAEAEAAQAADLAAEAAAVAAQADRRAAAGIPAMAGLEAAQAAVEAPAAAAAEAPAAAAAEAPAAAAAIPAANVGAAADIAAADIAAAGTTTAAATTGTPSGMPSGPLEDEEDGDQVHEDERIDEAAQVERAIVGAGGGAGGDQEAAVENFWSPLNKEDIKIEEIEEYMSQVSPLKHITAKIERAGNKGARQLRLRRPGKKTGKGKGPGKYKGDGVFSFKDFCKLLLPLCDELKAEGRGGRGDLRQTVEKRIRPAVLEEIASAQRSAAQATSSSGQPA